MLPSTYILSPPKLRCRGAAKPREGLPPCAHSLSRSVLVCGTQSTPPAGCRWSPSGRRHRDIRVHPGAMAPGRRPAGEVAGGGFPQHEVARCALVRRHLDPRAGQHVVRVAPRQLAVLREAGDREQHVAFRGVGVAGRNQALGHRDDLGDVVGGGGLDVRREGAGHPECCHVLAVGLGIAVGDRADRGAQCLRRGNDLVIDVGDVARVAQAAVATTQQCGQHPEHHRPGVADVQVVVDRGPHRYMVGDAGASGWKGSTRRLRVL